MPVVFAVEMRKTQKRVSHISHRNDVDSSIKSKTSNRKCGL
jgi:hypothetical protein